LSAIGHDHHGFLVGDKMMFLRPVELDLMGRASVVSAASSCLGATSAGPEPAPHKRGRRLTRLHAGVPPPYGWTG
jgi:hypothetical protein